ncbi:MAG: TetR family transcriptional regulator [Actinophytocola sp.]|uniref:TetR/AcrR family transcriptional regulator n=1 Tax=Actinophytocola sp. TaxID=1872138 RepID=UPI0013210692|nr:TetR/AcrR family transcriptional regulator [Actinophytocola sp.]MPZ80746.1 TetR family transcriptional regulator [Actinophytocola sp.]
MAQRTYGGATGEERRARRRAALTDAALELFAEGGWERVTVRAVCGRARLNDRYFHESFADRDTLLLAARDGIAEEGLRVLLGAIATTAPDPGSRIRAVVESVIDFFVADPRRGNLVFASHEALRGRRQDMLRMLARIVADQAAELLGAHAAPEPDRELGAFTLVSGTMEVFSSWLRGEVDVTREHLADFLVAMIHTTGDLATALRRERR